MDTLKLCFVHMQQSAKLKKVPEVLADGVGQIAQSQGVAAASTGLGDVRAVLGALPCSCGRHRGNNDRGGHVAWDQGVRNVRCASLECADACMHVKA